MSSLDFSKLRVIHLVLIEKDVLINFDWSIDHEVNVEFIIELKVVNMFYIFPLQINSYNTLGDGIERCAH